MGERGVGVEEWGKEGQAIAQKGRKQVGGRGLLEADESKLTRNY